MGEYGGEGLRALHGSGGALLKLYRPEGPLPAEVSALASAVDA